MNVLSRDKQIAAISALTEGVSVRAAERLTGVNRSTILNLGVGVGGGCAKLHSRLTRDLQVNRIELDEIWSYVGKKQKLVTPEDGDMVGDQYTFIALADTAKAIITYRIGKRTKETTEAFINDLRPREAGAQSSSTSNWRR